MNVRAAKGMISSNARRIKRQAGWSLVEVTIVLTVFGVLIAMSIPSFHRAIEQSRANLAAANLRAIWSAERIFWLENRGYTDSLSELDALGLLDPTVLSAESAYIFTIALADTNTFSAVAIRNGSTRWHGELTINEAGEMSGAIQATGEPDITPGFQ